MGKKRIKKKAKTVKIKKKEAKVFHGRNFEEQ